MLTLADWLKTELTRRRISAREASLAAGLNKNAIASYLHGTQPSPGSCRKLAAYFKVPESFVLQLAGHVRPSPELDEFGRRMSLIARDWSEEEKQLALEAQLEERVYQRQLERMSDELRSLRQELEQVEGTLARGSIDEREMLVRLRELADLVASGGVEEQREVLASVFARIEADGEGNITKVVIKILYDFPTTCLR